MLRISIVSTSTRQYPPRSSVVSIGIKHTYILLSILINRCRVKYPNCENVKINKQGNMTVRDKKFYSENGLIPIPSQAVNSLQLRSFIKILENILSKNERNSSRLITNRRSKVKKIFKPLQKIIITILKSPLNNTLALTYSY